MEKLIQIFGEEIELAKKRFGEDIELAKKRFGEDIELAKKRFGEEIELAKKRFDEEFELAKKRFDEEFELAKKRFDEEFELAKKRFDKEIELAKERDLNRIKRIFKDGNQTSAGSNMKLKFRNRISRIILTGEEIKGEENTPIEVALVDDPTGNIVDVGAEASASVEIVLLKGESDDSHGDDWTVEEFNQNIVPEMEGKKPFLAGNVPLKLQRGTGVLENIKIRNHAIKKRPSVFKLGARVVDATDGGRIKEAKTESFTVRDFRNKYYRKHKTPSLSDQVFRLVNILKGGKINKRLQDNEINTVEDFLIRLLIDHEGLKNIVNLGPKQWKATVNNARACPSDKRMYCYINLEQKIGVVFNVFGQVLRLYSKSQYASTSMLSENIKADPQKLLASAYEHWGDVKPFDDVNSVQQHFTGLCMGPLDSVEPDYPGGGYENTVTSEMIGESRSRRSNFSFHTVSSTMNSIGETGGQDFGSFTTDDVEMYDAVMPLCPGHTFDTETRLQDFEVLIQQHDHCDWQFNGLMDESNADEQNAATAVTFVESQVVHTSNPPDYMQSVYSVGGLSSFDDRSLGYPGQVADSLICDTDTMIRALCANEHLQYFETDCTNQSSHLELSADIQGAINAINKTPRRMEVLVCVLRWRFSIKRIVARKTRVRPIPSYCE